MKMSRDFQKKVAGLSHTFMILSFGVYLGFIGCLWNYDKREFNII